MKKLLNTLFVTSPNSRLSRESESVVVKEDSKVKLRVPVHHLSGIVCFGTMTVTTPFLSFCSCNGVSVTFLSRTGRFLASLGGSVSGNVLLRKQQYRVSDDPSQSAAVARSIVSAKIANCRTDLMRVQRDHPDKVDSNALSRAQGRLAGCAEALKAATSLDRIRGLEGASASAYFSVFGERILDRTEGLSFNGRSKHPPLDEVNAMLSFTYVILMHDIRSALEGVGLDPSVGFLHRDRSGRYGLALDLMEEFRPFVADRVVLSLINLGQAKRDAFVIHDDGAVTLRDDLRKALLVAYHRRKQEEVVHPFLGEKVQVGLLFHCQALLLTRYLRGELDSYPAFLHK